jgi:acyl-CoA thioesterase YciA
MLSARQLSDTSVEAERPACVAHAGDAADTNPLGDMFGGWIMSLMDATAYMTATGLAKGPVMTVAVSNITFMEPIKGWRRRLLLH